MIPRDFDEQNRELGPPEGMTVDECSVLPVHVTGDGRVISCWHPSEADRKAIAEGKPIWLHVWGGQPPVALDTESPFVTPPTSEGG